MIIKDLLKNGADKLKENNIEGANNISRILFANILNVSKEYLIMHDKEEVMDENIDEFYTDIEKIVEGYPLQYITNNQEFMKLNFYVDENVLIPQPDTEILVEKVLEIVNKNYKNTSINILDLCTGSGAIAISIAKNIQNCMIEASDISNDALNIAKRNAKDNNVNIEFINSNLFERIYNKFDIIVSNPPYIESSIIKTLSRDVQNEPLIALDGGEDGLEFYRKIALNAYKFMKNNGYILLEIGYNQKEKVIEILENIEKYVEIQCIKDYNNNDRVIIAKKR